MKFINCELCNKTARYNCICSVYLCEYHRKIHLNRHSDHRIIIIAHEKNISDFQESKTKLIEKIFEITTKTEAQIQNLLEKWNKFTLSFEEQIKEAIKHANQFIELCNTIATSIQKIDHIEPKEFYNPLEHALLSSDIESFVNLITEPKIDCSTLYAKVKYAPSVFPHFLYNYSDYSIDFQSNHKIRVYPSWKNIMNDRFDWSSRFLNVGMDKLFFTGGKKPPITETFIFDLKNKEILNYPSLIHKRKYHSMAWIKNHPAVIGGYDGKIFMSSVEIYKDNKWNEISSINIPRNNHTSIAIHESTWIIGGSNDFILDSIEKFENNQWILLSVNLFTPSKSVGIMHRDNYLFLLGGTNAYNEHIENISSIHIEELTFKKMKKLEIKADFLHNHFYINHNEVSIYGYNTKDMKLIKVDLEKKYFIL